MKTKITIVLFILFSLHAVAQVGTVFTADGINYKITTATTVEVTQNPTTIVGTIIITETVSYNSTNYQVTSIGENAFFNCKNLTSITFPNTVTSIGYEGFYNCTGLTSVTIPEGVTFVSLNAFAFCSGLTSVTLPKSLKSIGLSAFYLCVGLISVEIPSSVTTIGDAVFYGCTSLMKATIPESVTKIGEYAFAYCPKLTSVTIPSSVTSIGDYAFYNCTGLTAVTVNGTTPIAINSNVFENITLALVTLNVPAGTETAYKAATVWKDFKVETTLGTNSFSTNNAFPFYPNPAQSQINFSQEVNNLEVFDIAGRKVKTFQNSSKSFDVSNLAKGIYLLKGKTVEGKTSSQKMVKE